LISRFEIEEKPDICLLSSRGIKAALLMVVVLTAGCGLLPRPASAPRRVYADLDRLAALHPGAEALRQLDEEIKSLASLAGVSLDLPSLAVPPPVTPPPLPRAGETPSAAQAESFVAQARQAGEKHLEALGRDLAETRERKVAERRRELKAALTQEMKTEEARAQEALWEAEQKVFERFRRRLFNLRTASERKDLPAEESQRLRSQIQQAEAEQQAALEAVRSQHEARLAEIRRARAGKMEEALSRFEAELRAEDEAVIAARRQKMEAELSAAAARLERKPEEQEKTPAPSPLPDRAGLERQLRAHRARAEETVGESRQALLSELDNLKAARGRLWEALLEEVRGTLEQIGAEHKVRFVFDSSRTQRLPDFTSQAAEWLMEYWQYSAAPLAEKSASE
jgi:hypothetical protein